MSFGIQTYDFRTMDPLVFARLEFSTNCRGNMLKRVICVFNYWCVLLDSHSLCVSLELTNRSGSNRD